jgi:hypothetical protein
MDEDVVSLYSRTERGLVYIYGILVMFFRHYHKYLSTGCVDDEIPAYPNQSVSTSPFIWIFSVWNLTEVMYLMGLQ